MFETRWYDRLFRAKGLFDGCKSVGEMAGRCEEAARLLRDMDAAGVTLDGNDAGEDDYPMLVTTSAEVAARFGMDEVELDGGEIPF